MSIGRRMWWTVALVAVFVSNVGAAGDYISQYYQLNKTAKSMPAAERAEAWVKVSEAANGAGDQFYAYFSLLKAAHSHLATGNHGDAADCFENALSRALDDKGHGTKRFNNDRNSIAITFNFLRSTYISSTQMALAEATQNRAEKYLVWWVKSRTGRPYDCMQDAPTLRFAPSERYLLWRIKTGRAKLLDLQGRTTEAVGLLEHALRFADEGKSSSLVDSEIHRTTTNLAIMYDFLGYRSKALGFYRKVEASADRSDRLGRRSLGFATFNRLNVQMKLEGYTREGVDEAHEALELIKSTRPNGATVQDLREGIAKMEARLGDTERAEKLFDELEADLAENDHEFLKLYTRRARMFELNEDQNDDAFVELLGSYRARGIKRGEPSVYREYAHFLASSGRYEEAIQMIARGAAMTEKFGWKLHLPLLWIFQAEWHDKLGQHAAAEALWKRIDTLVADTPDMPGIRRAWIVEARIERALRLGDKQLAAKLLATARDTIDKLGLNRHLFRTHSAALDLLAKQLDEAPADRSVAAAAKPATVDLQPIAVRTVTRPGEVARTRFSLSNVGAAPAAGRLVANGPILNSAWDEAALVWRITAGGATRSEIKTPPTRCPAGTRMLIEVEGGDSGQIQFSWSPSAKESTAGAPVRWEWKTDKDGKPNTMTTAHLAKRNPFYLVPLFQEIRGDAGTQNFRVVASAPCRLEIVDANGDPIAVDANGNGRFSDASDTLNRDADGDLVPDVELTKTKTVAGIELSIFADEHSGTAPIQLQFQLRDKRGAWETVAESIVR